MAAPEEGTGPEAGPAMKVSVSLRAGNVRAIRERVGARGFSAYVDAEDDMTVLCGKSVKVVSV